jgi:hypothetical protein
MKPQEIRYGQGGKSLSACRKLMKLLFVLFIISACSFFRVYRPKEDIIVTSRYDDRIEVSFENLSSAYGSSAILIDGSYYGEVKIGEVISIQPFTGERILEIQFLDHVGNILKTKKINLSY